MSISETLFPSSTSLAAPLLQSHRLRSAQAAARRWCITGSPSTVEQYGAAIDRWEAYCDANGAVARPATPTTVAAFLRYRRDIEHVGQSSLDADARAIRLGHLACRLPDPTDHPIAREALGRKRRAAQALAAPFAKTGDVAKTALGVPAHTAPNAPTRAPASALSLEELDPVVEFFKLHALAASTRQAYKQKLEAYKAFCDGHGLCSLPAEVDTVCRFLTDYGLSRKTSSLCIAKSAIRWAHHRARMVSPTDHPDVGAVLQGHARKMGTQTKKKYAFRDDDIIQICDAMDEEGGLRAIRDRALLLLGFAGCFRRSEMTQRDRYEDEDPVYLDLSDLSFTRKGVRITLRKSKTDQQAEGQTTFINYGARKSTCPVLALQTWLKVMEERGIDNGPVFRRFFKKGDPLRGDAVIGDRPLTGQSVGDLFKYWAEKIGLDPKTVSGHSVRRGHATTAAQNGASPFAIAKQGRWKRLDMVMEYVERSEEAKNNSSSTLGL